MGNGMTKQEELFFDRVALVLQSEPSWSIEQACQAVLEADTRILNTYSRLPESKQREMKRLCSDAIYTRLTTQEN